MNAEASFDVLITGGNGFLGQALTHALVQRGKRVLIVDTEDVRHAPHYDVSHVKVVRADVMDAREIDELVQQVHHVLHLAAVVGVHDYMARTRDVLDVNIIGTRNVIDACCAHHKPLILASTSETYGITGGELAEDAQRTMGEAQNLRWSYAVSKMAGEYYAHAARQHGLIYAIVRYFNVYGPHQDRPGEGRVISQFLGRIRDNKPLLLVDGGAAVRSFCYVDDAVDATLRLMEGLHSETEWRSQAFNIGRWEPVTMRDLATRMVRLSEHEAGTLDVPGEEFFGAGFEEIPYRVPDVRALFDAVGFEATTPLDVGLRKTLAAWDLLGAPELDPDEEPVRAIRPRFVGSARALLRIRHALDSGQASNGGPWLEAFERGLQDYFGRSVAAVSSGALALELALSCFKKRGTIIVPAWTYVASLNAIERSGFKAAICDISRDTLTIDPESVVQVLEQHPDVVGMMPVNVFGVPPDCDTLIAIQKDHDLEVLYDNAHGMGTLVDGQPDAPNAWPMVLSFHATKVVPAAEGGAVVSSDDDFIESVKMMRNHGLGADRLRHGLGTNAKMSEIHAAIACESLDGMSQAVAARRHNLAALQEHAEQLEGIRIQTIPANVTVNGQNFVVIWEGSATPEQMLEAVAQVGVEGRRYFHPPLHRVDEGMMRDDLPNTEWVWRHSLVLPLHAHMADVHLEKVCTALDAIAVLGR